MLFHTVQVNFIEDFDIFQCRMTLIFEGFIEMLFLAGSIIATVRDYGKDCDFTKSDESESPKIKKALSLMIFMHSLNVARLIY